jgi:chromosome partitioning protein
MIVTVGGQKGGTGKSTIAIELAIHFSKLGETLLIDADDQQTSTDFSNARAENHELEFACVQLRDKAIYTQGNKMQLKYDYIVIDSGGFDSVSQRYAIGMADKYIAVFKPESFALWTTESVETMVDLVGNQELQKYTLLNNAWNNDRDNDESAEILRDMEGFEFIPHIIKRRKAFCDASAFGISVAERRPKDPKAVGEIENVIKYVVG